MILVMAFWSSWYIVVHIEAKVSCEAHRRIILICYFVRALANRKTTNKLVYMDFFFFIHICVQTVIANQERHVKYSHISFFVS